MTLLLSCRRLCLQNTFGSVCRQTRSGRVGGTSPLFYDSSPKGFFWHCWFWYGPFKGFWGRFLCGLFADIQLNIVHNVHIESALVGKDYCFPPRKDGIVDRAAPIYGCPKAWPWNILHVLISYLFQSPPVGCSRPSPRHSSCLPLHVPFLPYVSSFQRSQR